MAWLILARSRSFPSAMRLLSLSISARKRSSCLVANGTILGDALLTTAEHVGALSLGSGFDLDGGLYLCLIARRRLSQDRGEAIGIVKIGQPAITLGLPAGDDVVQVTLPELGDVFVIGHGAVDHHGGAWFEAGALGEMIKHAGK